MRSSVDIRIIDMLEESCERRDAFYYFYFFSGTSLFLYEERDCFDVVFLPGCASILIENHSIMVVYIARIHREVV